MSRGRDANGVPTAARMPSPSAIFVLVITLYFAAQVGLRLLLGGALETDEAEMMVMTPGMRWGYGPQLPLYNWLQIGLFAVFGKTLLALSLLKNLLLWATYLLMFLGLRLWLPARLAAVGALSLYLVPDAAWEAQRATTHSNILLLACAATLAAFVWRLKSAGWAPVLALALAVAIGGLSKYNYVLVPAGLYVAGLSLPRFRPALTSAHMLVVPIVAAAALAPPYYWMMTHKALAFSSVYKLDITPAAAESTFSGMVQLVNGLAALAALPILVAAGIFLLRRVPRQVASGAAIISDPSVLRLLWRAAAVATAIVVIAVPLSGVGHITQRWLLPLVFLGAPALFVGLFARLQGRGVLLFALLLVVLASVVFAGLAYDRHRPTARRAADFTPLIAALPRIADMEHTPLVADYYLAGNIARARPGWRIAPYLASAKSRFAGETVLFLSRQGIPGSLPRALAQAGWRSDANFTKLAEGTLTLGFENGGAPPLLLRYWLVATPSEG